MAATDHRLAELLASLAAGAAPAPGEVQWAVELAAGLVPEADRREARDALLRQAAEVLEPKAGPWRQARALEAAVACPPEGPAGELLARAAALGPLPGFRQLLRVVT